MSRVLLIHWNAAEAEERAERLRRAGHQVDVHAEHGGTGFRAVRDDPPDAFLIDLGRLPSHGRAAATWLRQQKPTRHVPLLFVGGDPERAAQAKRILPDARFAEWRSIRSALREAIANPPADPVVPGTMDDYADTPLSRKLGIQTGAVVALLGAPKGFERTLGALPEGARLRRQARGRADPALLFARSRAELERRFSSALRVTGGTGRLWIAWPKKASGVVSDLTQARVRRFGLERGLVDYKVCAIDPTWSGLLFTRRRPKPG